VPITRGAMRELFIFRRRENGITRAARDEMRESTKLG
jgi:hypothetical protein